MPYRHAHYWLLALFPVIVLSFWPGYFGHLATARGAQHAHGASATIWLALLAAQSWSAHGRRLIWHRAAGLATFVIVPLFAAAGAWGIRDMAAEMNEGSPFEAAFAPALAPSDVISVIALLGFVAAAFVARRATARHAAWMLATAILVLPPVAARLIQVAVRIGGLPSPGFWASFLMGHMLTIAAVLLFARAGRGGRRPSLCLLALTAIQIAAYSLLGQAAWWRGLLSAYGASSPWPAALAAAMLALAALLVAWRRVPPRIRAGSSRTTTGIGLPPPASARTPAGLVRAAAAD